MLAAVRCAGVYYKGLLGLPWGGAKMANNSHLSFIYLFIHSFVWIPQFYTLLFPQTKLDCSLMRAWAKAGSSRGSLQAFPLSVLGIPTTLWIGPGLGPGSLAESWSRVPSPCIHRWSTFSGRSFDWMRGWFLAIQNHNKKHTYVGLET